MDWLPNFAVDFNAINHFFINYPIFPISVGISAVVATLVYVSSFSSVMQKELKRRRMKRTIDSLKDHYILCGFGRVGQQVAHELASEGESFVIIDREEAKLQTAKDNHWPVIIGDSAVDESLFETAHLDRAKGVIIAVGSDADAIFMAISARASRNDIFIVARASTVEAAHKLTKVGVNRVALPYQIGGYHMATMAIRPSVVDFLDLLVDSSHNELDMEEFWIEKDGYYDGKTLKEAKFLDDGIAVLAIRRANGKAVVNPNDTVTLHGGDRLVSMGPQAALEKLFKEVNKNQPESKNTPHLISDVNPVPFADELKAEK